MKPVTTHDQVVFSCEEILVKQKVKQYIIQVKCLPMKNYHVQ